MTLAGARGRAKLRCLESPVGAEIVIDGRRYVNFGGSSYLGLSGVPEIVEAGTETLRATGAGYQFARVYEIPTRAHREVEAEAAAFFGSEAAIYLAGGYSFGLVAIAALHDQYGSIYFDEMAHWSLREAIAASGRTGRPYRHLDSEDLESQLEKYMGPGERPLVVTDAMFSTFGEITPLDQLAAAIAPYGGRLLVDESHGFGVLGERGRGASEHHGLPSSAVVIGGSTSKAFGVVGGLVPASEEEVRAFRASPAARGASVGLPAAAAMCARSLRYVREHPELLERLRSNVACMKRGLRGMGLDVGDSIAPAAAFFMDSADSTERLQERLMEEGIYVLHSRYIGAGAGGVIRCGIFADHSREHIDHLLDALKRLM